jgi:hypothetical protein
MAHVSFHTPKRDESGRVRTHMTKPCAGALEATKSCLSQFLDNPTMVALFRQVDNNEICSYESVLWSRIHRPLNAPKFDQTVNLTMAVGVQPGLFGEMVGQKANEKGTCNETFSSGLTGWQLVLGYRNLNR